MHGQAHRRAPVGEGLQVVERRGRGQRTGLVGPQRAHQAAHRAEGLGAGRLDPGEGVGGDLGLLGPHRLRGLGLHDDPGHVVGDDVVELPGDGQPLVLADEIEVAAALVVDPSQVQPHPRRQGEAEAVGDEEQAVVADVVAGLEHRDEGRCRRRR